MSVSTYAAKAGKLSCMFGAAAFLLTVSSQISSGGSAKTLNSQATELADELLGAPVFVDGKEIGEALEISVADDGRVTKIRIATSAALGLGARNVEMRDGTFIVLRGAVVLGLPETVETAPDAPPDDKPSG